MIYVNTFAKTSSKFLRSIDIYGKKADLSINREEAYKTTLGGFFTLIIGVLFLLLFFNFGSDMIYHENPSTVFSEIYSNLPQKEYFSKETYFFMYGVQDPNYAHFIDDSIYKSSLKHYCRNKKHPDQTFTKEIETERCTEAHLPSDSNLKEYFMQASGSPLDQLFCAKNLDTQEVFMEGSFDVDIYCYLEIVIHICRNQTDNVSAPICKPIEEIKEKMEGYFAYYTIDYLIDPQNFQSPGQAIGKDYFTPISVGMTREINRYIATTKINSDDGFIFTSKNYYKYPTYSNDKESLLFDATNGDNLLTFTLRKSHSDNIFERNYKKIQDVLAEIGGFIQILYLFFWVLNYPFLSKKFTEKIVNTIYNFESEKSYKEPTLKNLDSVQPAKNLKKKTIAVKTQNENLVKYMVKIKNRPPLKLTNWEFFKTLLFSQKKKQKTYQNNYKRMMAGKKAVEEKLDISYLLKKFYEIDKIKMLLLNENQFRLFDYLPKPVILKSGKIDIGNANSNNSNFETNDVIDSSKKLYTAFNNIMKQNELSALDKKLIDLLDENVKYLLKVIFL